MLKHVRTNREIDIDRDSFFITIEENGTKQIEFDISTNYDLFSLIKNEDRIEYDNLYFLVKEISEEDFNATIVCNLDTDDLKGEVLQSYRSESQTEINVLNSILSSIGWKASGETSNQKRTIEIEDATKYDIILQIQNTFGCYTDFDNKNKILYVSYQKEFNENGFFVSEQVNLKKVEYTSDTYDIVTRIYGFGKTDDETGQTVTFSSINNGKNYVEDLSFKGKVISKIIRDDRFTDPQALYDYCQKELNKYAKQVESFELDIIDLSKLKSEEYRLFNYKIRDMVDYIDIRNNRRVLHRIVKIVEYPFAHEKDKITLSTASNSIENLMTKTQSSISQIGTSFQQNLVAINAKISGKLETTEFEALKAKIEELNVLDLSATVAKIEQAYISRQDVELSYVKKEIVEDLNAKVATIETNYVDKQYVNENYVTKQYVNENYVTTQFANQTYAIKSEVKNLTVDIAKINTLLSGSVTAGSTQTIVLNAENTTIANALIKSAMIDSLDFNKITGIDINTTKLNVHSNDGYSTWKDNTILIKDSARTRVQIGKDAQGDYNIYIWDKDGKVMFDPLGLTADGVNREVIDNSNVKENAGIKGSKLDIDSVITEVNGATTTIKSSKIYFDEKKQTLDVAFNTMSNTITETTKVVETANTNANNALSKANTAITDSANAKTTANTAKSTADNAKTVADGAKTTADSANTKATTASTNASNALAKANQLETKVTTVENTVKTQSTQISTAQGQIGTLITDVTQAKKDITTVVGDVTTAKTNITTLTNNYSSVKQTVDGLSTTVGSHTSSIANISTTANNALNTANTAKTTADSAKSAATTASTNANSALANANNALLGNRVYNAGTFKKFMNVVGYSNSGATVTGAMCIQTPITSAYMTRMHITGYNYLGVNSNIDVVVTFYRVNNVFYNFSYSSNGNYPITKVRLCTTSSADQRIVVILCDGNTKWYYPKLVVETVEIGHTTPPDTFKDGWSVTCVTTFPSGYSGMTEVTGMSIQTEITTTKSTVATHTTQLNSITSRVSTTESNVTKINGDITSLTTRMSTAEQKVTDSAIVATVTKSSSWTTLNTKATDAQTKANNLVDLTTIKDTRSVNNNPSWYLSNYPRKTVKEFKQCSTMGISGEGTYGTLETSVSWPDTGGGYPVQLFYPNTSQNIYRRVGTSTAVWGAWTKVAGTHNAISVINQTAESIKIQAAKIALEGLVTANSRFKILTDGSMEAVNGKFTGTITATSGNISGFTLASNRMYASSLSTFDFNVNDTNTIQNIIMSGRTPTTSELQRLDINGDGKLSASDYLYVQRIINAGNKITTNLSIFPQFGTGKDFTKGVVEVSVPNFGTTRITSLGFLYSSSANFDHCKAKELSADSFSFSLQKGLIENGDQGIEIWGNTPFIDFHHGNDADDYTSRLICYNNGELTCENDFRVTGTSYFTKSVILSGALVLANAQYLYGIDTGGTWRWMTVMGDNNVEYFGDNSCQTCLRGSKVYLSMSGATVTSDRRYKNNIRDFDKRYENFFNELKPQTFRFNKDKENLTNLGFIAQDVQTAIRNSSLDENHNFVSKVKDESGDELLGLVYDQFIALNTHMIQKNIASIENIKYVQIEHDRQLSNLRYDNERLKKKVELLEQEINQLKGLA